jgi:hypothetical protein
MHQLTCSTAPRSLRGVLFALIAAVIPLTLSAQPVRVSVSTAGDQANQQSIHPDISETGRFVVFESFASNLVPGDNNGDLDVFLHDRDTDADGVFDEPAARSTIRLTRPGADPNGQSFFARITPDGRYVVFTSSAANLIAPPDTAPAGARNVFRYDRLTGTLIVVSRNAAGHLCGFCSNPSVSDDGRYVVFRGGGINFDPEVAEEAIYLRDVEAGVTARLSGPQPPPHVDPVAGTTLYTVSAATISGDGAWILYAEAENRRDPQQRSFTDGALTLINRTTGETRRRFAPGSQAMLARDGRAFVACGTEGESLTSTPAPYWQHIASGERRIGQDRADRPFGCIENMSRSGRYIGVRDENGAAVLEDFFNRSIFPIPLTGAVAFSGGDQSIAFESYAALVGADTNGHADIYVQPASTFFDRDGDTLSDTWERFFQLSAVDPTGPQGPNGDLDFDGLTNAQEQAAGSHPRGQMSRFLAEGATGDFFETRIALANPSSTDVRAVVRFDRRDGTSVSQPVRITARSRSSMIAGAASLGTTDFSTVVESDAPLVVDRLMTWDRRRYGSHAETSIGTPSAQWFLAEGTTVLGFELFYLLQNPQATPATATVRFLLPSGAPVVRTYDLGPRSRTTIHVNGIPQLASTDVSADISATQPIVVERAMYRSQGGQSFALGHAASGIPQAATNWFLAEGATGAFFDTYVLIANPSAQPATVTLDFLRDNGTVVQRVHTVGANARFTVFADGVAGLEATTFGTRITSTAPIVVERAMYWAGGFFDYYEGHVSAGSTVTGQAWVLAEGEAGGDRGADTFVLIANTASVPVGVAVHPLIENTRHQVTLLGTPRQLTLPANSRVTVALSSLLPDGGRAGVEVRETDAFPPGALVVEGAIYWHTDGVVWGAGAALPATRMY